MHSLVALLNYASAFSAFMGALLWWKAASIEAPGAFIAKVETSEYGPNGSMRAKVDEAALSNFHKARQRPGNWNRYTTAFTGLSAALMATALVVGSH